MLHYQSALDGVYQALGDPTRRGMVERLSQGPATVSDLARPLEMTLSAVVQHLKVLEASGLVRSDKLGRVRTVRLVPDAMRQAEEWFARRRAQWEQKLDRLGAWLAAEEAAMKKDETP